MNMDAIRAQNEWTTTINSIIEGTEVLKENMEKLQAMQQEAIHQTTEAEQESEIFETMKVNMDAINAACESLNAFFDKLREINGIEGMI